MPTLIAEMIIKGMTVRIQRAEGYWMDIGRINDYERANVEFDNIFL